MANDSYYVEFMCRECKKVDRKKSRDKKRVKCYACEPKCKEIHIFKGKKYVSQKQELPKETAVPAEVHPEMTTKLAAK